MKHHHSVTLGLVLLLSITATTKASFCTGAAEEVLLGYALGTQADNSNTASSCYYQAFETSQNFGKVMSALQNWEWSMDWWHTTFSQSQAFIVNLSDQMEACQDINKIKQLDIRMKNLSGAFNLFFTFFYKTARDSSYREAL